MDKTQSVPTRKRKPKELEYIFTDFDRFWSVIA